MRTLTDGRITEASVAQLGAAWTAPITGVSAFGGAATNPIVLGDTVSYQDLKSNVVALDLASGREHWRVDYNADNLGPSGVAVGYGKIFAAKDAPTADAVPATVMPSHGPDSTETPAASPPFGNRFPAARGTTMAARARAATPVRRCPATLPGKARGDCVTFDRFLPLPMKARERAGWARRGWAYRRRGDRRR